MTAQAKLLTFLRNLWSGLVPSCSIFTYRLPEKHETFSSLFFIGRKLNNLLQSSYNNKNDLTNTKSREMGITKLFQTRRCRKTFAFKTAVFLHHKGFSRESHKGKRGRFQQIITENRNYLANICMHRRIREQCRTERLFLLNILLFRLKLKMCSSEMLLTKYAVVYFWKVKWSVVMKMLKCNKRLSKKFWDW